jgi:hypothetical protein
VIDISELPSNAGLATTTTTPLGSDLKKNEREFAVSLNVALPTRFSGG